ncbi:hypothetical protein C6P61_01385 [Malikia spinosa]|uniref:Uncharacterized protein n=1 Tax=Malikia spinosa TaxID=86180 RepID=A0A2S9KIU1_9BURK|nr:hypothetical protein C6P61_01385 [Malikia spinosa]
MASAADLLAAQRTDEADGVTYLGPVHHRQIDEAASASRVEVRAGWHCQPLRPLRVQQIGYQ